MPTRPPSLTPTSRMLIRWMDVTACWPQAWATAASAALFVGVIALDFATGAKFSVGFLYLLACAFAVWCSGEKVGFGVSLLSAFAAAALHHQEPGELLIHRIGIGAEAWNLCARLLSFGLVAAILHGLHSVLRLERWRATHDELTGALNKAGFEQAMVGTIQRAQAKGCNLVLAYMDLDGFKDVNDQNGHSAGDHVLKAFAVAAAGAVRPNDLFARIGGDEFAALLQLPPQVDGHHVADLLHRRLTAILTQTGFDVTCSMGAVFMTSDEAAVDYTIMEQADALMYEVKRAGKNALRVARGNALSKVLRTAFPPLESDELDELLRRIDMAERGQRWGMRRAA